MVIYIMYKAYFKKLTKFNFYTASSRESSQVEILPIFQSRWEKFGTQNSKYEGCK